MSLGIGVLAVIGWTHILAPVWRAADESFLLACMVVLLWTVGTAEILQLTIKMFGPRREEEPPLGTLPSKVNTWRRYCAAMSNRHASPKGRRCN